MARYEDSESVGMTAKEADPIDAAVNELITVGDTNYIRLNDIADIRSALWRKREGYQKQIAAVDAAQAILEERLSALVEAGNQPRESTSKW